jgi:hypothetical protein
MHVFSGSTTRTIAQLDPALATQGFKVPAGITCDKLRRKICVGLSSLGRDRVVHVEIVSHLRELIQMIRCPQCNTANFDPSLPCSRCGKAANTLADQQEGDLLTPRTKKIVTIVAIAFVVIVLGIAFIPYIVWTLAGPMPSLG